MFYSRKRPGRRNDESFHLFLDGQRPIQFRKPQVVADAKAETHSADRHTGELIARYEALVLFDRRSSEQMDLSVLRGDIALGVDENLRIEKGRTVSFRNAADNCNRKTLGDLL